MIKRRTKYNNKPTYSKGIKFDSKKEALRDQELTRLEKKGEIHSLQRQVAYEFRYNNQLICKYIPDFVYKVGDETIVEDVKSKITSKNPVYRIKNKLMKAFYGIDIKET